MKHRFQLVAFITSLLVVMSVLLAPFPTWAQSTGTIKGILTDENGKPLAGANVSLVGTTLGDAADQNGAYLIENVPPGTYKLRVRFIGYRPQTVTVAVRQGETVTKSFTLKEDPLLMEEVVVTGTRTPRAKLESTVAISTLSPREITMANPRSTTEMLRYIPGFTRVESSGGEVNENISVRGIFGVEYVMFMEDGMPVFPTMHTYFMNADNLIRPDENIAKMEVVRGGNAALFGSNTPGAIINFINKTGGPVLGGELKFTVGTYGFARHDFNVNGPLGQNWRFNMGGFYRYDHGIRNPGFPGIRGGQLKANITRFIKNGYIRLSGKIIDDRNQFILPLPFENPDNPKYVPGFSDYGAMSTNEGNHIKIPLPMNNGELELPLDDGIRTKAYWITSDMGFELPGGWSFQNMAQFMKDRQEWNAILPFDVMRAEDWASESLNSYIKDGFVPAGATYKLLYTNHRDGLGNKIAFNTPNGLLAPGGEWHVEKPITAFQNQMILKKKMDQHNLSLGLYFGYYTQNNRWFFTDILTDVRDQPRFVDMVINYKSPATGQDTSLDVTKNGFRHFLSMYANGSGHTTIFSAVVGDEFKLTDRFRADVGVRYEYDNFVQVSGNNSTYDLDGDPATKYDVESWGNQTFRYFDQSFGEWAASAGLNYSLSKQLAVYAQGSRAYKMPALDEFLFPAEAQASLFEHRHTMMGETGVKYSGPKLGLSADVFWARITNIKGQGAEVDSATGALTWVLLQQPETRSYGAELEASVRPFPGLSLLGSGTFIKAEYGSGSDIGSWLAGIPPIILNFSGTYTVSGLTFMADWHYVGRRWVVVNENKLNAYNYVNLGLSYKLKKPSLIFAANLLNVLQSTGFEEGNPRLRTVGGRTSNLFLARPILPRRFMFSVKHRF